MMVLPPFDLLGDVGDDAITGRVLPVLQPMQPSTAVLEWLRTGHRTTTGLTLLLHLQSTISGIEQDLVDVDDLEIEHLSDFWSCRQVLGLAEFADKRQMVSQLSPYWQQAMDRWDYLVAFAGSDAEHDATEAIEGSLVYLRSLDTDWQAQMRGVLDRVRAQYPEFVDEGWIVHTASVSTMISELTGHGFRVRFPDGQMGVTLCRFGSASALALIPRIQDSPIGSPDTPAKHLEE